MKLLVEFSLKKLKEQKSYTSFINVRQRVGIQAKHSHINQDQPFNLEREQDDIVFSSVIQKLSWKLPES